MRFRRIVFDEAQVIRNPETQTSTAVRALHAHAHYKWILTGNPLLKQVSLLAQSLAQTLAQTLPLM